jgi:hypothetical protein
MKQKYSLMEFRQKLSQISGSMVSSVPENFLHSLPQKPILPNMAEFELELKSADGTNIPFLGYVVNHQRKISRWKTYFHLLSRRTFDRLSLFHSSF